MIWGRLGVLKDFDFSGHVLERVQIEQYECNWKTFIEVYLRLSRKYVSPG